MKENIRPYVNYILIAFIFLMSSIGVYILNHVSKVNSKQTDGIERFVEMHRALHCINDNLEIWQYDEISKTSSRFRIIGQNETPIRCIEYTK